MAYGNRDMFNTCAIWKPDGKFADVAVQFEGKECPEGIGDATARILLHSVVVGARSKVLARMLLAQ